MLFNSYSFVLFFPAVTIMYFALPHKIRWLHLLICSCIFYMAFIPSYILILLFTISVDYAAGILIERVEGRRKKIFLVISILSTCLILIVFKYFNFLNANLEYLAAMFHLNYPVENLSLILPIGLSFHTFQSLSYVIEVYRGNQRAEYHFGIYALYVMFYPQLVAGPIERPQNMLHQFREVHPFDHEGVVSGLKLMAWGFFKKLVIADNLAIAVNNIYGDPQHFHGLMLITAVIFFSFQIFCDFSGYSDIAIGAARVMGFNLTANFNRPYYSKSVFEFWKRWHITLSSWFRDYLYIPLGGNRTGKARHLFNLLLTFIASGLWHGANWTFILWGALHGFYQIFGILTKKIRSGFIQKTGLDKLVQLHNLIRAAITFALVTFAWIFFRANSIQDALYIISNLFTGLNELNSLKALRECLSALGLTRTTLVISVLSIIIMELVHRIQRDRSVNRLISACPALIRWSIYYVFLLWILNFRNTGIQQFIYFQF